MTRDQRYRQWERAGYDTTLVRAIDRVGDERAKVVTAKLKAKGLKGLALLRALQAALDVQ